MSGTAFANDPGYYLQVGVATAPACGPQSCIDHPCQLQGVPGFSTVFVSMIADCHKGEGFLGVYWGMTESTGGTQAIHTGFTPCPGFIQAPGTPPAETGVTTTVGCELCCTAVGNHSYLLLGTGEVIWQVNPHAVVGGPLVVTCDNPPLEIDVVCVGGASVNSPAVIECQCNGPTATEETSWGSVKALYN